jgi:hypothetical protein
VSKTKELVVTERSLSTYRNFGIQVKCRVCGKLFKPGDRCIKTRPRAANEENPFFCPEHFFTENIK